MADEVTTPNADASDKSIDKAPSDNGKPVDVDPKTPDADKVKPDEGLVPSRRLKEEADKRRDVEKRLTEFEQKEAQAEEKKKLQAGKYEEVISSKDKTIEELKASTGVISEYEKIISEGVEKDLATIKTGIGEENLKSILDMLGYEGKTVLEKKNLLGKIGDLASKLSPPAKPTGGTPIKPNNPDKKAEAVAQGGLRGFLNNAFEENAK